MFKNRFHQVLMTVAAASLLAVTGCRNLPGEPRTQGAVLGGVGGAAAGAAIGGEKNQVLGALLGGVLGAGAGYVIGANSDRFTNRDTAAAEQATRAAQARPATAMEARNSTTADINHDGFVTLDEVAAMSEAGFSEQEMLERLRATGQIFQLTPEQQDYLRSRGVSPRVVAQMHDLNRDSQFGTRDNSGIISRPQY